MKAGASILATVCALSPLVCVAVPAGQQARADYTGRPPSRMHPALPALIFTAAPVYDSLAALHGGERFPRGAQLLMFRAGRLVPLAPGLAASADASVAFDGKAVLLAGKKRAGDPWQIWMAGTDGGDPQRVMAADTDLIRPHWMPGGRMVYARRGPEGFALETAALDGSATLKLSYLPGNFIPDDVLRDGRVLFESGFPLGAGANPELFLVYSDGSGVESVRCDHASRPGDGGRAHGRQMLSGDIVFTHGGRIARFTSSMAGEAAISAPPGEYAGDVAELPDGQWLVAMRMAGGKHYRIASWAPGAASARIVAQDAQRDLVEPVVVAPRAIPNRHPSGLHDWTTGNLLALNARLARSGMLPAAPARVEAQTLDRRGHTVVLGTAPVESDGSFFVQAKGDEPLRFVLLDAQGRTIRQEQGWFWVRSGEQRICVGCHTGPERAPDNRVPAVLLRTTTPVDLTGGAMNIAATQPAAASGGH